jgi:hypothetical protein
MFNRTNKQTVPVDQTGLWSVYMAEEGEERARANYRRWIEEGKALGIELDPNYYPDGKPIE